MKHHIIKESNSKHTLCGLSTSIIRCRPRYGFCNLESNHSNINIFGQCKQLHHDAYAVMDKNMISLADDNDFDSDICAFCLKNEVQ